MRLVAAAAEGWSFRLTPQARAPSFGAQVDIADRRAAETDVAVFDDLEAVPSVEAEIRFRRFGLLAEWTDLDVGEDARTDRGGRDVSLDAGWRHLDVEYEKGDIAVDFALIGASVAVDFVFRGRRGLDSPAKARILAAGVHSSIGRAADF